MDWDQVKRPAPRHHGGQPEGELLGPLIDFSVNTNPYGPHPAMLRALERALEQAHAYPHPSALPARRALAALEGVAPDGLVAGNGSAELLWGLAGALAARWGGQRPVAVVEPAFSEFGAAAQAHGLETLAFPLTPPAVATEGWRLDMAALHRFLAEERPSGLYLCLPSNPTGATAPLEPLFELAQAHPATLFILDQAYLPLSTQHGLAALAGPPNVARLRSLTKAHAIPGVRAGYLLAHPQLCRLLEARRPPWTVSALAQAACLAAVELEPFVAASRQRMLADKAALAQLAAGAGLLVEASQAAFFVADASPLAPIQHQPVAGGWLSGLLRERGFNVRDCASFGLPRHVRLSARPQADQAALALALAGVRGKPGLDRPGPDQADTPLRREVL